MARTLVLFGLPILGLAACDPAATDPAFWERAPAGSAGTGEAGEPGAEASASAGGGSAGATSGDGSASTGVAVTDCASISLTTVSYDGHYEPDNVGAVWITDGSGAYVRTLEIWGSRRLKNAVAWRDASGGDDVDAITGATRQQHGTHDLVWDCRDAAGQVREAGAFELHAEFTEEDSAEGDPPGPHRVIPIDLEMPGAVATPDDPTFRDVRVVVRP